MKRLIYLVLYGLIISSCNTEFVPRNFSSVEIETIVKDSTLSIRALDFDEDYVYYGSADHVGKKALNGENKIDLTNLEFSKTKHHYKHEFKKESGDFLHFRAIAVNNGTLFAISVANPARLFKIPRKAGNPIMVYEEIDEKVFYDSMAFWNDKEGIAIGDPTEGCMSIIITRDGGNSWNKISCENLPEAKEGEAAFAASDTNIAIVGDRVWVATGGKASRILHSADKGITWEVINTPIVQGLETTGIYSIDFYDDKIGYGIGGDYTKAADSTANKIKTTDGGKTWNLVAENEIPGYRSCVQFIPNGKGMEMVAVGYKGIDYSNDGGNTWTNLSDEGFYTIRFINENEAFAAGRGRLCKLTFEE